MTFYFTISNKFIHISYLLFTNLYFKYTSDLEISYMSSSKILKQSTQRTIQFSVLVENFRSFVTSKAEYESVSINFNNTEWYVRIELYKYCQESNEYIRVTPSSPEQPETLGLFLCGRRSDQKECSFDVGATFKFKRPRTAQKNRISHKFCFNLTNHDESRGERRFGRIDVILALSFFLNFFM